MSPDQNQEHTPDPLHPPSQPPQEIGQPSSVVRSGERVIQPIFSDLTVNNTPVQPVISPIVIAPSQPVNNTEPPAQSSNVPVNPTPQVVNTASITPNYQPDYVAPAVTPGGVVINNGTHEQSVLIKQVGFKPLKLIMILLLILIIAGISAAGGVALVNKSQESFNAGATNKWVSYSDQSGNFTARFPTQPTAGTPTTQTTGVITYTYYYFQAGNSNTAYLVGYSKLPNTVNLTSNISGALNGGVQGQVNYLRNGQLVSSSDTTVSGYPAETYEITGAYKNEPDAYLTGEIVIYDNTIYDAFTLQNNSSAPNTQYFLNHFSIGH